MSVEVLSYRLALHGKPVGSLVLRTLQRGRVVTLESRLALQGQGLSGGVTQTSRLRLGERGEPPRSLYFFEETTDRGETRRFELHFDADTGLVKATRGANSAAGDTAQTPYLQPYLDPLSLLYRVRRLTESTANLTAPIRVPMLGKEVVVERLGDVKLETASDEREAEVFSLRPGSAFIYVDKAPPHHLLRLTQPLEDAHLNAFLVRADEETPPATPSRGLQESGDGEHDQKRGKRPRRRRRGRRRG